MIKSDLEIACLRQSARYCEAGVGAALAAVEDLERVFCEAGHQPVIAVAHDPSLAFVRRRITGEAEVDDFGFDPELTDQVLITLLRLNGIPARWQSGMMFSPTDYWNLHDWGQVYIAPYGWVPIDVTFGRMASNPDIEWFYLGGLDGYRVAFNDEWGVPFFAPGSPQAKHSFRSETVDSQRGEAEWRG